MWLAAQLGRQRARRSVAAVALVLAVVPLLTPIRGALGHQLALSLACQPEPYTEVFFPEPLALPTNMKAGVATPFVLGHHVHPAVPQAARAEPQPTGIDYLVLVLTAHDAATTEQIAYRELDALTPEPPA